MIFLRTNDISFTPTSWRASLWYVCTPLSTYVYMYYACVFVSTNLEYIHRTKCVAPSLLEQKLEGVAKCCFCQLSKKMVTGFPDGIFSNQKSQRG
jgi:hypothetical protein